MKHEELIERLQGLDGPDREVFFEAFKLCCPMPVPFRVPRQPNGEPWWGDGLGPYTEDANKWNALHRKFQKLVDAEAWESAALTLVPPDMRDELDISTMYQVARVALNINHEPDDGPYYGSHDGNSISLAIVIAALRARGEG